MQSTVTVDRHLWVGGSDIPAIMGLSPFRTRWEVLLEKAQIQESDFEGNIYTEYGNMIEGKVRDYINRTYKRNFVEDVAYTDDCRFHLDGWDEQFKEVLEIKSTSKIHSTLAEYKAYLVQELAYMARKGADVGLLAVYERPEDFSEDFDPDRLTVYMVFFREWQSLWEDICFQLDWFRADLAKLRENPLLTEEDLMPKDVVSYAGAVALLEDKISAMKQMEKDLKAAKAELKKAMEKRGIKRWITNNGAKITLVADGDDTVVSEFNLDKFKEEQPEMYAEYLEDRLKPGKAGFVRITLSKE